MPRGLGVQVDMEEQDTIVEGISDKSSVKESSDEKGIEQKDSTEKTNVAEV
jgi:hypothetical protein